MAAVIIVAIILGFAAVNNYVKKKTDVKIYDLKDELNIEGANVIERGIYGQIDTNEMAKLLEHFTFEYFIIYSDYSINKSKSFGADLFS